MIQSRFPPIGSLAAVPRVAIRLVLLLAACLCSGCATRLFVVEQVADLMTAGMDSYEQEEDLALLKCAFPAHIKLLEAMARSDPQHPGINLLLARLYAGYAFAVIEPRLEALWPAGEAAGASDPGTAQLRTRADLYYRRGAEYAMAVLSARHPDFQARMARIDSREEALANLDANDVPALFWYAFNLGRRVDLNRNDLRLVARAHMAEKAMQRVVTLQPDYYHGAAHLFLMVYSARHPAGLGSGSPVEGHYQAIARLADGAKMAADVFYAGEVLVRRADRPAFTALLDTVIKTGGAGARCLLDRVALARAGRLKTATDLIFANRSVF